jgi:hypothetical protein
MLLLPVSLTSLLLFFVVMALGMMIFGDGRTRGQWKQWKELKKESHRRWLIFTAANSRRKPSWT